MNGPKAQLRLAVALVDDDQSILAAFAEIISSSSALECAAKYSEPKVALAELPPLKPDAVLMDIRMPGLSGIDLTQQLKPLLPSTNIIMVTGCAEAPPLLESLKAGADGYLTKGHSLSFLPEAIFDARAGKIPICPEMKLIVKNSPLCHAIEDEIYERVTPANWAQLSDETLLKRLHDRVLWHDTEAANELAEILLPLVLLLVFEHFRNHSPPVDPDLLREAAIHSILIYLEHPESFLPKKNETSLAQFLALKACSDVLNELEKEGRRRHREDSYAAAQPIEAEPDIFPSEFSIENLENGMAALVQSIQDPVDLEFVRLMAEGEHDTVAFAKVLGIQQSPKEFQQREVKKARDRIRQMLRRKAAAIRPGKKS